MSAFDDDAALPRLLGGRYLLEAVIGSGGMGVVYRATDQTMRRVVAVKLVRGADGAQLDDEVAGRFLREAKNTARLVHENIIEVYDLGRSGDDLFFVMELLEGESLSAKLRRDGKLDPKTAVHVARQMCAALEVAHSAGIIHRDLKPANVMLLRRGNDPCFVKVLDFGVAKSFGANEAETQLTHTGMLVGTVEYMAPEQIMGRNVDGRTDLYSLGIVLYRMLTGKQPFRDGGVPALIHAHLNKFPAPVTDLEPDVPGELDRVVLRCLAKQPTQRYESMTELSRALAAAITPADSLMSLEYVPGEGEASDVYEAGDMTEVARPGSAPFTQRDPLATVAGGSGSTPRLDTGARLDTGSGPDSGSFEDMTVKMDRVTSPSERLVPSSTRQRTPRMKIDDPRREDGTAMMNAEDHSTQRRKIEVPPRFTQSGPVAQLQLGPRECAMCHTMNAPHARACAACGVSLAVADQEAVRARVVAPRTAHMAAPQMPPPLSGGYPVPQGYAPGPGYSPQGAPGVHTYPPGSAPTGGQPWPPPPPHDARNAPPSPSVWERFLKLTGLR